MLYFILFNKLSLNSTECQALQGCQLERQDSPVIVHLSRECSVFKHQCKFLMLSNFVQHRLEFRKALSCSNQCRNSKLTFGGVL